MFVQTGVSKFSNSLQLDLYIPQLNEGKSAASFCHQVAAAWFPDMICNFYFMKNHKNAKKTQQPLKLQKNKHRFGILTSFRKKI
jgi:hypothetical protein